MKTKYELSDDTILDVAWAIRKTLNNCNNPSVSYDRPGLYEANPQYSMGHYASDHTGRFCADMDFRMSDGKWVQVTVREIVPVYTTLKDGVKTRSMK